MYPLVRMAAAIIRGRRAPPMALLDTHVSHHICWPWDIDPWMELNNGRALTLFDLGRVGAGQRIGLPAALRRNGWGLAVAGSSVRYRRRTRAFDRLTMTTRCAGWDERFIYTEQALWKDGACSVHVLIRSAVAGPEGIVPPARLAEALGLSGDSPPLAGWIRAWIEADATRPWPPGMAPV